MGQYLKILSLDLGKFKSVACFHETDFQAKARTEFRTVLTDREVIAEAAADVVVFETCTAAGWLADLCEEVGQAFFVVNPNGGAWPPRAVCSSFRSEPSCNHFCDNDVQRMLRKGRRSNGRPAG